MSEKPPRIIIFYYEWPNTAGNHAGMAYFARCLKRDLGTQVKLIKTPKNYGKWRHRIRQLWRSLIILYVTYGLNKRDVFFFMEYLSGMVAGKNREFALNLRKRGVQNRMIGLVHLPLKAMLGLYDMKYITNSLDAIDEIVVFGSSLADDLNELGYSNKTNKTFHYVDTDYYHPAKKKNHSDIFNVIAMGFLYRNRNILKEVVSQCPDIVFHVFLGNNEKFHKMFKKYSNVVTYAFVAEYEMLDKMHLVDASISIFDDTIGSNVITTSLSCGLPQVVSDVGSVSDYCTEKNTFFCKDINGFVTSLKYLRDNKDMSKKMSRSARKKAEEISLNKSINWFRELFANVEHHGKN